jgi:UDP-glucose 4-epimerase
MSVAEAMAAIRRATGNDFAVDVRARRPGDPPRIVAGGDAAARDLGWRMSYTVDEMMASAWRSWQAKEAGPARRR